jgi:uncharacterized protein
VARPFVVSLAALRRAGGRHQEVRHGPLSGLRIGDSYVPSDEDVVVDVILELIPGGVVASGTVTAPFVSDCRRCLGPVRGTVSAEIREIYQADVAPEDAEEIYPLSGDQLDLEPLARDAVLLELPIAPLCREACLGLCPTCGANLNEGSCSCPEATQDPRWAGLDTLHHDFPQR